MTGAKGRNPARERALLIGAAFGAREEATLDEEMDELGRLAETAGAEVVGRILQRRNRAVPSTLIGRGKIEEISARVRSGAIDLVVFLNTLTPVQIRNISDALEIRVLDRVELILDIFAQHARSRDGKLQVELAQLRYLLPRLTGRGVAMSRLGGGIGTRGPGEKQLEVDRRKITARISRLNREVEDIARHRRVQRKGRKRQNQITASLVGYTNAGKSTLLNALAGSDIDARDQLFSTLDPTTRRVRLPGGRHILVTDTIGFIRRLPENLAAAFRSALEEIQESDILIHVADGSDPNVDAQVQAVDGILKDLNIFGKETLTLFNKKDRGFATEVGLLIVERKPAVAVSAATGQGLDQVLEQLDEMVDFLQSSGAALRPSSTA